MSLRLRGAGNTSLLPRLASFGGMTFFKDYSTLPAGERTAAQLAADYSLGSAVATITASRGASNPATYIDESGIIRLVTASNTGRKTAGFYDSTGFVSRPGLIVEGAMTNMLKDSYFVDGTTTYWRVGAGSPTIAPSNDYANIYGGGQVEKVIGIASDVFNTAAASKPSFTNLSVYTVSGYIRGTGKIKLRIQVGVSAAVYGSEITLSNDKWYRYQAALTANETNSGNVGIETTEAGTYYIAGFQCELSPFATTFIPTTTAALTRNAETLTYPISGNRTAATESLFIKATPFWTGSSSIPNKTLIDDDGDRRLLLACDAGSTSYKTSIYPDVVDQGGVSVASTVVRTAFQSFVVAGIVYGESAGTNSEIYIGGSSNNSSTTNYGPFALGTNMTIGQRFAGGTAFFDGIYQSISIFSSAKSASDVAAISALLAA